MKKHSILALVLILSLVLGACGMRNDEPDNGMTILPTMDSTIGTNIPDPDIDTKMPIYTEATEINKSTNPSDSDETAIDDSRQK